MGDRLPGFMVIPKLIKRKVTVLLPVALFCHLIKLVKLEVCATSVVQRPFLRSFCIYKPGQGGGRGATPRLDEQPGVKYNNNEGLVSFVSG